jgi:trigger factor
MPEEKEGYLKQVESPADLKRVLHFEVPRERVEAEIAEIINGIRREVSLPGFRKGKAPVDMVKARFAETAQKEAIEKIVPEAYRQALETESLRPVMPAEISDMVYGKEGPLSFQVAIELHPEVNPAEYKGLKVEGKPAPVEDADVDKEVENLRLRLASFEKLDREAQPGDVVVMDYWRLDPEGNPEEDSKVTGYPVEVGAGGLVREFEEALPGMSAGETRTIRVTYPEDFPQEEMRGKQADFGLEIKEVGMRLLPELNDELATRLGAESVLDLRNKVREGLTEARRREADDRKRNQLLGRVVEASDFEVPQGMVDMALESMLKSYREEHQGADKDEVEAKLEQHREQLRSLAINMVKEQFIVDEIAKRENITVGDNEIEDILKSIAARTGITVEQARRRATESEEIGRWRRDIIRNKVLGLLLEHADIQE